MPVAARTRCGMGLLNHDVGAAGRRGATRGGRGDMAMIVGRTRVWDG